MTSVPDLRRHLDVAKGELAALLADQRERLLNGETLSLGYVRRLRAARKKVDEVEAKVVAERQQVEILVDERLT